MTDSSEKVLFDVNRKFFNSSVRRGALSTSPFLLQEFEKYIVKKMKIGKHIQVFSFYVEDNKYQYMILGITNQ